MVVEVRPLGVSCNLNCSYCYQHKYRQAGKSLQQYDLGQIKTAIREKNQPVDIFGGEPLLIPVHDLDELLSLAHELHGYSTLQTNGVLMNEAHLDLFEKYHVYVGFSCDGPGRLNDMRRGKDAEQTREFTAKTLDNLVKCRRRGLPTYLQVQLTKINATAEALVQLKKWFKELDQLGIRYIRIHVIDTNCLDPALCLTEEEYLQAYTELYELEKTFDHLRFDIFDDMRKMLQLKDDDVTCVFRGCDPYTNEAVAGISGNGEEHNCGAMDDEGIYFQKPKYKGYERSIMLYSTPYEFGGCRGCRFFLACKGHCPGNAMDNDWRNRSIFCNVWRALFAMIEEELKQQGIVPASRHEKRLQWEATLLEHWQRGYNIILEQDLEQ